jgi:hypothetical protein
MGRMLENIGRDVGEAFGNVALFPGKVAEAGVRKLEGKPFLSTVRHHAVDTLWSTLALPFRILKHTVVGVTTGTLRLTWNAIKLLPLPIPMLDSWKKERGDVMMRARDALDLFRFDIDEKFRPPLLAMTSKQHGSAAAATQAAEAQAA